MDKMTLIDLQKRRKMHGLYLDLGTDIPVHSTQEKIACNLNPKGYKIEFLYV